ncbi:MAG: hypothetical protein EXQ52_05600 [Bryobacterales bacterium]|nr:hypothetical protein [Bryobacterales bacterium]
MERGDHPAKSPRRGKALIQPMEKPAGKRYAKQTTAAVWWNAAGERSEEPVRAIAIVEDGIGMRTRKTVQEFLRIDADSGEIGAKAVCGVERDSQ